MVNQILIDEINIPGQLQEDTINIKKFRNVANNFIHDWKIGKKNHDSKLFCDSLKKNVICWFF